MTAPATAPARELTRRRVTIGFAGGGLLATRVGPSTAAELREAIASGDRWYELASDEGAVLIAVDRVAYLQIGDGEERLGFN